ncbi:hypothetical protein MMC13_001234 [Lambiella insularis]|nr:hypothetical protein [Lambiella insularis]
MRNLSRAWIVSGLASTAIAQTVKNCPQTGVCYSVNVPAVSASSGSGDIYIQITAPSSMQWVGLGQGGRMAGSNILIIYSDSHGQNVTLAPRLGTGNFEPEYNSAAHFSLLEGSGISNNIMTANVRCSSCSSWNGGSMSFTDSASSWIWAVKNGAAIASDSASLTDLSQHDAANSFNFDLTKATGGNSLNPFISRASSNGVTTSGSASSAATGTSSSSGSSSNGSGCDSGNGSEQQLKQMRAVAHGVIMGLACLVFFPFGALSIRFLSVKGTVWIHATAQLFAYTLAVVGTGIGIWLAVTEGALSSTHPIIGLAVLSALFLQPFLGLLHHFVYRRTKRRTLWAVAHVWWGRAFILLGAINGAPGLKLSCHPIGAAIGYGVIAVVLILAYVAVVLFYRRRSRGRQGSGEKVPSLELTDITLMGGQNRSRSTSRNRSRGYGGSMRGPGGDRMRTFI